MWKSLYLLMTPIKIYTKYLYFLNESSPKQYGLNFSIKQEDNSLFLCKFARYNHTFVKEQI